MDGIAGLFVTGFDGPDLPDAVAGMLARGLAGVTLFRRNIIDRAQVSALCRDIRQAARPFGLPPIIAVDQEGGRVQRLRTIGSEYPAMRDVPDPFAAGEAIGSELAALGFNLDFAPVLDVDSNPSNPIIGDRSFSGDPTIVAGRATAFFMGLAAAGIGGCGKHFPGHGDASADSHLELPVITADRDTLLSRELPPFQAAAAAGFRMFMTAHCLYPAVDPVLPATLSPAFIEPWLRARCGFDGVVITDDLGMKAIADRFSPRQVVELGMAAGVDLFLHCGISGESDALMSAMAVAIASGTVAGRRFGKALERVHRFRASLA